MNQEILNTANEIGEKMFEVLSQFLIKKLNEREFDEGINNEIRERNASVIASNFYKASELTEAGS